MIKKRIISATCIYVLIAALCGCEGSEVKDLTEVGMQQFQDGNNEQELKLPDISLNKENKSEQSEDTLTSDQQDSSSSNDEEPEKEISDINKNDDYYDKLQIEKKFDPLFASIDLPINSKWIKMKFNYVDENSMKIDYTDLIAEADCTLIGVRGAELDLPDIDYGNATITTRENFHSAIEGKTDNAITLKKSENKTDILVTWEYGDYKFAIIGKLQNQDSNPSSIEDTAGYIIEQYMNPLKPDENAGSESSNYTNNVAPNVDGAYQQMQLSSPNTEDAPADADGTYREAQSYPKEYEDLQAAISKGMSNKELPFVTSSGIYENPLRVEVTVNTKDEVLLNKLKAYDKTGKMLKITYSAATAVLE